MKKVFLLCVIVIATLFYTNAFAEQLRVFVSDVNAIGVANRDEMKQTIQALLSARLNNDRIISVASASEADVLINGNYIAIGKIYSMDALAKSTAGRTITRVSIQGETKDELIGAVGNLAEKLSVELAKKYTAVNAPTNTPANTPIVAKASPMILAPASGFIQRSPDVKAASVSDFIKPKEYEQGATGGWLSKRMEGAYNIMAVGSTANGARNIFMAEDRKLLFYKQSTDMKLLSEIEVKVNEKIISLDVLAGDGSDEIYLTVMRDGEPVSQVLKTDGNKLVKVTDDLPWLFRTCALAGGVKKLYAQAVGRNDDFYGSVYEAKMVKNNVVTSNSIEMPRFGNIYTFNQFNDAEGKRFTVVINPDYYLIVYDDKQKEVWRSNDKFGGSELSFQREDLVNIIMNGGKYRSVFMNQRIQVSSKGEVLVGKNDGFWVGGNSKTYKKGAVYNMVWNGSSLEEKWRTKDTQNYMPDYYFDEQKNELLILQTVQRTGFNARGASSLAIKKVE